jgi:hypothetical protein
MFVASLKVVPLAPLRFTRSLPAQDGFTQINSLLHLKEVCWGKHKHQLVKAE